MVNERPTVLDHSAGFCKVCGRPSQAVICEACGIKIRGEALILKKHKDKGEA